MHVLLTGATGYIGSAVLGELTAHGHRVSGLVRSDAGATALGMRNVQPIHGDVRSREGLAAAAATCDGVIHTAFINDFSQYAEVAEIDRQAVEAIGRALAGSDRPFVATSVVTVLPVGRIGVELDQARPEVPRAASETTVLAAAALGVRASLVRLPFSNHGAGDRGFVPALIELARRSGFAGYVGSGQNRWPMVARPDTARLFRLALERGAAGSIFHAVSEEGLPMREIAAAIGVGVGVPVRSLDPGRDAEGHFGWLSRFVALDQPVSSALTRERLAWTPTGDGLLTNLKRCGYFDQGRATKY